MPRLYSWKVLAGTKWTWRNVCGQVRYQVALDLNARCRKGRDIAEAVISDTVRALSPHAILQAAAILIVASVGERRKELVQQVTVRAV